MMSDTIVILSPGEMGHAVGRVLVNHRFRVITSLAGRSRRTADLSRAAGIEDVGNLDCLVDQADIVLSIMPSAAAPVVAAEVANRLSGRGRTLTFVECNAIAPQTVREIEGTISGAGGLLVDVGIIGGPPTDAYQPRLYASGPHVDSFLRLKSSGLDIRPIGSEIGQASGMKMCYAALTKGLSALGTEIMVAAAKLDLIDSLHEELRGSQAALFNWLDKGIPRDAAQVAEMGERNEGDRGNIGTLGPFIRLSSRRRRPLPPGRRNPPRSRAAGIPRQDPDHARRHRGDGRQPETLSLVRKRVPGFDPG